MSVLDVHCQPNLNIGNLHLLANYYKYQKYTQQKDRYTIINIKNRDKKKIDVLL